MKIAKDLMTNRFLRISNEHTLREALGLVLYGEEKSVEVSAIVVIDCEGEFSGILTPERIVQGLTKTDHYKKLSDLDELKDRVEERFPERISSYMHTDVPILEPSASLTELIYVFGRSKHECLPVSVDGRVEGLVYVSDVFKATAELALTAEHQGITIE